MTAVGGVWKHSTRRARLEYLKARLESLAHIPDDQKDMTDDGRASLDQLCTEMTAAGLYSGSTAQRDRVWGIRTALGQIRRGQA